MKTRTLDRRGDGGVTFTEFGFGTAPIGNLYRAISDEAARATLDAAWDAGMRTYDTAPLYGLGLSETRLNPFLRAHPRSEVNVSTKVGRLLEVVPPSKRTGIGKFFDVPSRREVYDYSHDGILRSLDASLERLGLNRSTSSTSTTSTPKSMARGPTLDRRIDQFMASGYDALVRLRDEGVIRAFGAGLNEWQVCETLARRGDFDLFLLAGRYTLLEQEALDTFLPLCTDRNIGIVLGGPYNSGILATGREARRLLRLRAGSSADPRPRRPHRARLRRPRRASRHRRAPVPAPPPGGRLGDPRRPERPRRSPPTPPPSRRRSRRRCGPTSRPRACCARTRRPGSRQVTAAATR